MDFDTESEVFTISDVRTISPTHTLRGEGEEERDERRQDDHDDDDHSSHGRQQQQQQPSQQQPMSISSEVRRKMFDREFKSCLILTGK